jgi:uncharacterized protein YndB with AHSA1/START domain
MTNTTATIPPTVPPTGAIPDRIERELVLAHPVARVWTAITDPAELAAWFGDAAEVELRPGGRGRFSWGEDRCAAVVEVVDEPHRFAFWWTAGVGDAVTADNRTLVDITLEPLDGGVRTRLRLVETGFAALAHGERQHADNEEGWTAELGDLVAHLDAHPAAPGA